MTEEWRPVLQWEGLYEVSSFGRVRSLPRRVVFADGRVRTFPAVVRKQHLDGFGYPKVTLKAQGTEHRALVHHMVCEAFHGPRPAGAVARHLDGVPLNCAARNLAWGTYPDNHQDSVRHGTAGRPRVYDEAVVARVRAAKGKVKGVDLAAATGMSKAHISNIQNGNRRTLGY